MGGGGFHIWRVERLGGCKKRRRHPLARGSSLAELSTKEWLVFGLRSRAEDELSEVFQTYSLPSPPLHTLVNSIWTLLTLLSSSDAVAFLPRILLRTDLFSGKIIEIPDNERIFGPKIVLVRRAGVPLTPAADTLAELIRKAAHNMMSKLE